MLMEALAAFALFGTPFPPDAAPGEELRNLEPVPYSYLTTSKDGRWVLLCEQTAYAPRKCRRIGKK